VSFNKEGNYTSNQAFYNANIDPSDVQHRDFQLRKWQVLVGTFLFILIIANGIIWSQAKIFQSQAILHFTYPSQTEQEFGELAQRQITLHQQRLKSNRVLNLVAQELEKNQQLTISSQALFDALSAESSLAGRIIILKAKGNEPQLLKPILDAWVKVYLQLIESETQINNKDESLVADQQLQLLELKIIEQEEKLQSFANKNNITSLERDENRALSQTKNLASIIDKSLAEQAEAQALLNSLLQSINDGQAVIRPVDKTQIDATRQSLQEITTNLSALSEKYTQTYLERDPSIVAQQQQAQELQRRLEAQIQTSQADYLLDVKRQLNAAKDKVKQMTAQLDEQSKIAQDFSQNLEQYRRLDDELKALQTQAQTLKNQQIAQEVSKPFEAKITLLEPAFIPDFAIGPNYLINSLFSLIVAALLAILALLLFSFIFKQKISSSASNFVVFPAQARNNNHSNLGYAQQGQLTALDPRLSSEAVNLPPAPGSLRLLSHKECQQLFSAANNQGKALIGLILSGVNIDELLLLKPIDFEDNYSTLQINNQFARRIVIQKELAMALQAICHHLTSEQTIWSGLENHDEVVQLLVNIGHDAQIDFPEQLTLNVLRHTYITYLATQGVRLNDIEQLAGYTSPSNLAAYRNMNQQGKLLDIGQVKTQYPFGVSS